MRPTSRCAGDDTSDVTCALYRRRRVWFSFSFPLCTLSAHDTLTTHATLCAQSTLLGHTRPWPCGHGTLHTPQSPRTPTATRHTPHGHAHHGQGVSLKPYCVYLASPIHPFFSKIKTRTDRPTRCGQPNLGAPGPPLAGLTWPTPEMQYFFTDTVIPTSPSQHGMAATLPRLPSRVELDAGVAHLGAALHAKRPPPKVLGASDVREGEQAGTRHVCDTWPTTSSAIPVPPHTAGRLAVVSSVELTTTIAAPASAKAPPLSRADRAEFL